MKRCCDCKQEKNISEFHKGAKRCKPCAIAVSRFNYHKRKSDSSWYLEYKEKRVQQARERKQKAVKLMGNKCYDCGNSYPDCVYDFHHLDPNEKDLNPSAAIKRTEERMMEELKKCVMLCANCHRIRHFGNDT
jgi:hypothetical protein